LSSEIIELALAPSRDLRRAEALLALCEHLLALLGDQAADDPAVDAPAFRLRIAEWREALREESDPGRLRQLSHRIVAECERFLDRTRGHRADREAEFLDLVRVLREVVDAVRGEARQFEDDLIRSTSAMERMVEIEDIRELKRELTREVRALKQAVVERQAVEVEHFERLTSRVTTLEDSLAKARAEAATDALTGIANRGAFDVALRERLGRAAREPAGFSLAIVDLDDFKRINDTHGHLVGDRVIRFVSQTLKRMIKGKDTAARFGGEEFAIVLPDTPMGGALALAENIRRAVADARLVRSDTREPLSQITVSIGVGCFRAGEDRDALIERADQALYAAKQGGRNRVVDEQTGGEPVELTAR
jgi:diguanylate cyclase